METKTLYREHLSEPWFTLVSLGLKTFEGRLCKDNFINLKKDDIVIWTNNDFNVERFCFTKIINIDKYETFEEYLNDKSLEKCVPGIIDIEVGLSIYQKYYSLKRNYPMKIQLKEKSDEEKYGVVSFELEKMNYSITLIFNGVPDGCNYVKTINEAYQILNEHNKNNKLEWEIDNTHTDFDKYGTLYMLKQKFCDIDFLLEDLSKPFIPILKLTGDSKNFKNIDVTCDETNETNETNEDIKYFIKILDKYVTTSGRI